MKKFMSDVRLFFYNILPFVKFGYFVVAFLAVLAFLINAVDTEDEGLWLLFYLACACLCHSFMLLKELADED